MKKSNQSQLAYNGNVLNNLWTVKNWEIGGDRLERNGSERTAQYPKQKPQILPFGPNVGDTTATTTVVH